MRSRIPPTKMARQYLLQIGRDELFKKKVTEFPTLRHFPSERDILMTVTPNLARLEPMETRHPYISRDIEFDEIRVQKGLQKAAQRSGQKQKERTK